MFVGCGWRQPVNGPLAGGGRSSVVPFYCAAERLHIHRTHSPLTATRPCNHPASRSSFLQECVHARMRRYTAEDENAFFPELLPAPALPFRGSKTFLKPNNINVNSKVCCRTDSFAAEREPEAPALSL